MIGRVRHLIVATANLAEAEARALKKGTMRVGTALGLLLGALAMALGAFGLALAALFNALWPRVDAGWAYLACSVVCVGVAAGLAWLTARVAQQ